MIASVPSMAPETAIEVIEGTIKNIKEAEQKGGKFPKMQQWGWISDDQGNDASIVFNVKTIPVTWAGKRVRILAKQQPSGESTGIKIKQTQNQQTGAATNRIWVTGSASISLIGPAGEVIPQAGEPAPPSPQHRKPAQAAQQAPAPAGALTVETRADNYFKVLGVVHRAYEANKDSLPGLAPGDLKDIATHISIDCGRQGGFVFSDPATHVGPPPAAQGAPSQPAAQPAQQGAKAHWSTFQTPKGTKLKDICEQAERGESTALYTIGAWAYATASEGMTPLRTAVFEMLSEKGIELSDIVDDILITAAGGDTRVSAEWSRKRFGVDPGSLTQAQLMEVVKNRESIAEEVKAHQAENDDDNDPPF